MKEEQIHKLNIIVTNAVNDGIELALNSYSELSFNPIKKMFIPKHEDFPTISNFSSGLPYFYTTPSHFGFKISYNKILADTKKDVELKSWVILVDFFLKNKEIYEYIKWDNWNPLNEEKKIEMYTFSIHENLRSIIDSIIHSLKNPRIDSKLKTKKISNWVNSFAKKSVDYELIIPIIFLQPDCQKITLDKNIRIEKIDPKLQLSRHYQLPRNVVAHQTVIGASTHAIIISNILSNIPNDNKERKYEIIKQRIENDFDIITKVFSVCRLATNESVGFCQVLAKPIGFEENWLGELPSVKIFGYKNYPPVFEKDGWHEKKIISKKQLSFIKKYLSQSSDDKNIKFAQRKLFYSDLRANNDDSVIDIATGLEALLSDSTDNLKYKISLRSAAICKKKKFYQFTPIEVKTGVKTFYDFRSAIVHGNDKNIRRKKTIILDNFQPIDTLWFGRNILKHLIEFLMLNPKFSTIEEIDNYLLNEE